MSKRKQRFLRALGRSSEAVLRGMEAAAERPARLGYFIDLMRSVYVEDCLPQLPEEPAGRPGVVGLYCVMAPEELVYAAGALPLRLCGGSHEASCAGDELAPRDACPVVKASLGSTVLGAPSLYAQCDMVVVPTTCDAKRKMAEELSRHQNVRVLEVPHVKESEGARRQWLEQLYGFKSDLERLTGNRIGRRGLAQAIALLGRARHQARRLYELRQGDLPAVRGSEAALALHAFAYDRAESWCEAMTLLNDEIAQRQADGRSAFDRRAPRIMLAGAPPVFPNWKLPLLIEEMGGMLVTDESCIGDRYLYDPVGAVENTMEDMMVALASRYLMPCTCPSFAPNEDRLFRLRQAVTDFRIEGVLYHVLKGCVIYDFELLRVEALMAELGVPVLRIETDYNPEDIEQLRTRVEAFVEMIREKKRKGVGR
ncbi:MAG: 2-hydroxyacyl-CoA dehydratase family protein [Syntrophotalea acetylenica]|nr:2-hydroxyacyl-CoA dehydratase family protein [Syntrophotalea acetylenica]